SSCAPLLASYLTSTLSFPSILFFFNAPATTEIYTLSLHDALPICLSSVRAAGSRKSTKAAAMSSMDFRQLRAPSTLAENMLLIRSEEHTSELQSLTNLVCRLLLEKKKIHK